MAFEQSLAGHNRTQSLEWRFKFDAGECVFITRGERLARARARASATSRIVFPRITSPRGITKLALFRKSSSNFHADLRRESPDARARPADLASSAPEVRASNQLSMRYNINEALNINRPVENR